MKFTKTILHCKVALPVVFSVSIASAQEPLVVYGGGEELPAEKPISAFKTDTPIIDIPQSATIVTQEEMANQGMTSLADLVQYTPGLNNAMGEGNRDSVIFRGVRSTADFYVDGQRDDVQYFRTLYNLEAAEILRGPSAMFFGSGGRGGVINRVTKSPDLYEDFTDVTTSVDTFGATSFWLDYNKTLSDKQAFRLNLAYDYLNNHRDFYDGNQFGVNPTYTYQFTEDTSLTASFEYNYQHRFTDRGIPTSLAVIENDGEEDERITSVGSPISAYDGIVFADEDLNYMDFESYVTRLTLDHRFSEDWKSKTIANYGVYDKFYSNLFPNVVPAANPSLVALGGYNNEIQRQRFQLTSTLNGKFETGPLKHNIVLGGDYIYNSTELLRRTAFFTRENGNRTNGITVDPYTFSSSGGTAILANGATAVADFDTVSRDLETVVHTYGVFLQDEIEVTDWLDLTLGIRFDSYSIESDGNGDGIFASQSDTNVAPRAGIVLKPMEDLSFYGSYSQSFLPSSGDQFLNLGDGYDPDVFENLEIGAKWNVNQDMLFTLAAFQTDANYADDIDGDGLQERQKTETFGIEAQLKGHLTDNWFINVGYTYLDAEAENGLTPLGTPDHSFSIWNQYQFNDKLAFGLGATYRGETKTTNNESASIVPDYIRVDASISYNLTDDMKLSLFIENLLDTDYYPDSHALNQVTVGAPINAKLAFTARF